MPEESNHFLNTFSSVVKRGPEDVIPNTMIPSTHDSVAQYFKSELETGRLDSIRKHLWWSGLPHRYIRPLHRHNVLGRQVVIAEDIGLHLVSRGRLIYVKPIPYCFLNSKFVEQTRVLTSQWAYHLLGFYSTYPRMIRYESDFRIAMDLHLLPDAGITWKDWCQFSKELEQYLTSPVGRPGWVFGNRFDYGELRLDRLNTIFTIRSANPRGYEQLDITYADYFKSVSRLAVFLIFAVLTIALSAFQVAFQDVGQTNANSAVISVGFWFSIIALIVVAIYIVLQATWFLLAWLHNVRFALSKTANLRTGK